MVSQLAFALGEAFQAQMEVPAVPDTAAEALMWASIAIHDKNYIRAEALFDRAFEISPSKNLAMRIAHFQVFMRQNFEAASEWFSKAYDLSHSSSLAFRIARFCEDKMGDQEQAKAWIAMGIRARNTEQLIRDSQERAVTDDIVELKEPTQGERIRQGWHDIVLHLNPCT